MRHSKLLTMFAWLAVLSIGIFGEAFAQVPSLVTQQLRLSTGGPAPNYVQLRAKAGVAATNDFYAWDQAPVPTAGVNYSLWLDANNNIERSNSFGLPQAGFLMQVNVTGTGLQWVDPASLTTLAGDIIGPANNTLVNVGWSGLDNRLINGINDPTGYVAGTVIHIDRGGTNSIDIPVAGAVAYGDGTKYMFTLAGTAGQVLSSTGAGTPVWVNSPSLLTFNNALTKTLDNVQFGGPLVQNTSVDQATFLLNFSNGTLNLGSGANAYNINVDVGAAGNMTMKNIAADVTAPNILALDAAGNVRLRSFGTLVTADNGLIATGSLISMGAPATGGAPLLTDRFISLSTHALNYEGAGNFNIGDGAGTMNIKLDPSAAGFITAKNVATLPAPTSTDRFMVLETGTDRAYTRTLASLVNANNGLVVDNTVTPGTSTVQLGSPATGGALLLTDRFVGLSSHALNIEGSGNINLGDGAGTVDIKLDPGAAGAIQMKNVANFATPTATDRFVMLDPTGAAGDKVFTRTLSSLVNANNGLIVDNTVTPGTSTVQLGSPATGGALLLTDRFVGLATHALNYEGDGSVNVGTGGNVSLNVNTGATGNMTLQGTTLSAGAATPGFDNMAFVDQTTHNVRIAKTSDLTRNDVPTLFLTLDAAGNVIKSITPTAGLTKGQIAGNGNFQYTSPAINIVNGASITATIENHTGVIGAISVQITNVTAGPAGTFSVESSESIQNGSFINWVVINP